MVFRRDVKGANILVDTNGKVKLADFGMAKHVRSFLPAVENFVSCPVMLMFTARFKCINALRKLECSWMWTGTFCVYELHASSEWIVYMNLVAIVSF